MTAARVAAIRQVLTVRPGAWVVASSIGGLLGLAGVAATALSQALDGSSDGSVNGVWTAVLLQGPGGYLAGRFVYTGPFRRFDDLLLCLVCPGLVTGMALSSAAAESCPRVFALALAAVCLPVPFVLAGASARLLRSAGVPAGGGFWRRVRAVLTPAASMSLRRRIVLGSLAGLLYASAIFAWVRDRPDAPIPASCEGDRWSRALSLSSWDAARLEVDALFDSDNPELRAVLLQFHSNVLALRGLCGADVFRHYAWFVRHRANDHLLRTAYARDAQCDRGVALWKSVGVSGLTNTSALQNAAAQALECDPHQAEALLKRAEVLDPRDDDVPGDLGSLYSLKGAELGLPRERALELSLDAYERSVARVEERFLQYPLSEAAWVAADLGDFERAERHATRLLQWAATREFEDVGMAIHKGHLVLGRVALSRDDVRTAREELLRAADTAGSPTLRSFGPNMQLAKELLARGERDVVLQYFEALRSVWAFDNGFLDDWSATAKRGETPDFGPNLRY